MPETRFGNTKITYKVVRSDKRKTVGLAVDPKEGVIVTAPDGVEEEELKTVVKDRAGWILEKMELLREIKEPALTKEFMSGEKLQYLGRRYMLKIDEADIDNPDVTLKYGKFFITIPKDTSERRKTVRNALLEWYYDHALDKLKERVKRYADKVGVEPNSVKVKHQQKRWGSCTKDKDLLFNWRIIMAPMSIVDYVVVHELCHLKEKNHTDAFWRSVKSVIPDHEERKEWLRVNGPLLVF